MLRHTWRLYRDQSHTPCAGRATQSLGVHRGKPHSRFLLGRSDARYNGVHLKSVMRYW